MTRIIRADARRARIVPRLAADAHEQAAAILAQAKLRAAQVLSDAEQRATELARAAEQAARSAAQREAREALSHALSQLARAESALAERLESEVSRLALAAAQHIVGAELAVNPAAIAQIVGPLLDRVRRAHTVTMHVHPEDAAALRSALVSGALGARQPGTLQIVAQDEIARGGCVVVSEFGALDARIDARLAVLQDTLNKAAQRHGE